MKDLRLLRFFAVFLLSSMFFFTACEDDDTSTVDPRGNIVSHELMNTYNADGVDAAIDGILPEISIPAIVPRYGDTHGIDVYKIIYETIDAKGNPTLASGSVAIPNDTDDPLPMISYQHGTIIKKSAAPSGGTDREAGIGLYLGSDGFITVLPDYLGLGVDFPDGGDAPGRHPYVHAASHATAVVDLLRAVRIFCDDSIAISDELFLFGYSQGGFATMAASKVIQEEYSEEFTITATAPMSGPYDMSDLMVEVMLSDEPYAAPYYLPYTLLSYSDAYDLYDSPSDFFLEPYATDLPPLFDGYNGGGAINNKMPDVPKQIIKPEILEDFATNSDHPFRKALKDNDLYDWKPEMPMRIYACDADEQVDYRNAERAFDSFQTKGASDVKVIIDRSGTFDHGLCVLPSMKDAKAWMDTFRN